MRLPFFLILLLRLGVCSIGWRWRTAGPELVLKEGSAGGSWLCVPGRCPGGRCCCSVFPELPSLAFLTLLSPRLILESEVPRSLPASSYPRLFVASRVLRLIRVSVGVGSELSTIVKLEASEWSELPAWTLILGMMAASSGLLDVLPPGLGAWLTFSWCKIVGAVDQNTSVSIVSRVSDLVGTGGPFRPWPATPSRCIIPSAACCFGV